MIAAMGQQEQVSVARVHSSWHDNLFCVPLGKSTFVRLLTNDTEPTSDIATFRYVDRTNDVLVTLVDTPGFDSIHMGVPDTNMLGRIANFLQAKGGQKLNGIVYLHRITDRRFGFMMDDLRVFRELCGKHNLDHVLFVTTFWDFVSEKEGRDYVAALYASALKPFIYAGAKLMRHDGGFESAKNIIADLACRAPVWMNIQEELNAGMTLGDTSAGAMVKELQLINHFASNRKHATPPKSDKAYADAEVQTQSPLQHDPGNSPLQLLLSILRDKKPESPIASVVNVITVDLMCTLLFMKDYVNAALQLNDPSDIEDIVDLTLYLLINGYLEASHANHRARRMMLKLIMKTPFVPRSLFVSGVSTRVNQDSIGQGGFGLVFKGELGGAPVALKVLYKTHHNLHSDFCREALIWRSFKHEFVLPFLGICNDESASRLFLVSPYMKNGTLSQWRKRGNPPVAETRKLVLEVAEGLHYIHSEGMVHGDLRGENVLLDANFHAQIADFGLTRHSEATATRSGALHINFAAPELFGYWENDDNASDSDDDAQATIRTQKSDVYAFGCLYYEIHHDVIPFAGTRDIQLMKLVSQGKRPSRLSEPPMSDNAWKLIKRCWVKEAVRRPAIVEKMMAWKSA